MARIGNFIELARPGQWIKNGFVLLPLFFAQAMFDPIAFRGAVLATVAFCLAASSVYAFNDTRDAARDRLHPDKRTRPVARGDIAPASALAFSAILCILALILAATIDLRIAAVFVLYLVVQLAYSLGLKRIAWLDVSIVASGFALRIIVGGLAAMVPLTPWILLMGFVLALMLALGKRHGDLVHVSDASARGAARYSVTGIERVLAGLAGAILVAYVFYAISPEVMARHGNRALVLSTPWVVLGILRYIFLVFRRGAGGDPSRLVVRDPVLLSATVGWLATLAYILYH
ncbi:MAG TPA: UbiA prenyltransferase family protein [Dokdonella sp.]|uniref:UbiA prenyltransferase family protein n=1 Tax=Dokdonella sp. TaxID=2291710 RepID=UPI002D7F984A|nr:UbiA prenyltransferase family protein [Dokdonella sp.]HET9031636.1 UbiA prenyltransferase family protein [Dokdonella sp.]